MKKRFFAFTLLAVSVLVSVNAEAESIDDFSDEISIGVMEFSSGTMELVPEQAIVVGNVFTQRLAMSVPDNITIVGHGQLSRIAEENHMSTEGYVSNRNAARIGRLAGCRYIIAGIVTDLKRRTASTGVHFIVRMGQTIDVATAGADIRLIDTETGEALLSIADTARATQKDSQFNVNVGEVLDVLPRNISREYPTYMPSSKNVDAGFGRSQTGMEATSMFLLSSRLSMRVVEAITGKYPVVVVEAITGKYPVVSSVSGKEVTLSIGSNGGAVNGMLYRIFSPEGNIAIVQLKDVQANQSRAKLYSKGYGKLSLAREGDRVFPTDIYEAKAMIKNKTFIHKREGAAKKAKSSKAKKKESRKSLPNWGDK
ncbi:MAG: hypothetical protein IJ587_08050 [Synergistaceae bacterium]|nr:hypothetical protein [Synergistaceae bacterium]